MSFFKARQSPQGQQGPCPPYKYRAAPTPLARRASAICAVIEHNRVIRRWMREYRPSWFDVRALVKCQGLVRLHTPMSQAEAEADYRKWHNASARCFLPASERAAFLGATSFEGRGGLCGGLSGIVGAFSGTTRS